MQTKETGRQFVLATHNAEKREELARILQPIGIVFADLPFEDVEETGSTFLENARLKARQPAPKPACPPLRTTPAWRWMPWAVRRGVFRAVCRSRRHGSAAQ